MLAGLHDARDGEDFGGLIVIDIPRTLLLDLLDGRNGIGGEPEGVRAHRVDDDVGERPAAC